MRINDPEIVAELQALYPQYETALVTNDAEKLTRMFWDSTHVTRFGITENLYGTDEIAAFRKGRAPANLARTVRRLDIVTFGRDHGSVTLEFEREVHGKMGSVVPGPGLGALPGRRLENSGSACLSPALTKSRLIKAPLNSMSLERKPIA